MITSLIILFSAFVLALGTEDDLNPLKSTTGGLALRNQFPYMVSIEREWMVYTSHVCGGTIISHTHVLTASHCRRAYGTYIVVAGIQHLEEITDETQTKRVAEFISHPDFKDEETLTGHDIAIVILESPFTWSKAVQPVYLPRPEEEFTGMAVLSGWGEGEQGYTLSLRYASKKLISLTECAAILNTVGKTTNVLDEKNICTSGPRSQVSCIRDSGSALVKNGVLVGVVSRGILPCGQQNAPTVYTRSSSLVEWIQSHTNDLP
ncbi:prostasin-like isoform X1 [Agrilus planipennis]|uniref:Prostasin-like isoform X1 n=2 Tax=Agrilus planipennis TaxID=224129 RepID=A0A1W4WV43_AGRPL|nr:prostasin-like isoform X1 [Agrilus planipennis]XP_018323931.1 prostasin-like isoform X1 [Agrilus planipennis]